MKWLLSVVLICFATPALAICIQSGRSESDRTCITIGGNEHCVLTADLPNGSRAKKAQWIEDDFQAFADVRQLLLEIPLDDPDRAIDPDQGSQFWGEQDGAKKQTLTPLSETYLIGRCAIITITVAADGTYQISAGTP
jgi:hypothetical protein